MVGISWLEIAVEWDDASQQAQGVSAIPQLGNLLKPRSNRSGRNYIRICHHSIDSERWKI